jgi:hypothetical protein
MISNEQAHENARKFFQGLREKREAEGLPKPELGSPSQPPLVEGDVLKSAKPERITPIGEATVNPVKLEDSQIIPGVPVPTAPLTPDEILLPTVPENSAPSTALEAGTELQTEASSESSNEVLRPLKKSLGTPNWPPGKGFAKKP